MMSHYNKARVNFTLALRKQLSTILPKDNVPQPSKQMIYELIKSLIADQQMKPTLIELIRMERELLKTKGSGETIETMVIRSKVKSLMEKIIREEFKKQQKKQLIGNGVIQIESDSSDEIVQVREQKNTKNTQYKKVGEQENVITNYVDVQIEKGRFVIKNVQPNEPKRDQTVKNNIHKKIGRQQQSSEQPILLFKSYHQGPSPLTASICHSDKSSIKAAYSLQSQKPVVVTDPFIKSQECGHFIQGDQVSKIIDHYPISQGHDFLLLVEWQRRRNGAVPKSSLLPFSEWKYYKPEQASTYAKLFSFSDENNEQKTVKKSRGNKK